MHYHYLQDKDPLLKQMTWEIMESHQEEHPYIEFGWNGFILIAVFRENPKDVLLVEGV